ncbi:zinc-finger homeodomain protein 1-like [Phoenix dactylifera]|uniref:Zinc-finger homeodomain protein 1-like n=1 Tax=Phoenix dactylifera TaxID=42345 RepID=A0A8B9AFL0_PHODC|nr:zinc-finger homeodomain protein 1-like [Phoenix dactylifera]
MDPEMDFDDHDEPEEEIGLSVGSGYEAPLGNSDRGAAGGGKRVPQEPRSEYRGACGGWVRGVHGGREEGTLDGLRCAACSCHRNFHRKETEGGVAPGAGVIGAEYHQQFFPYYRTPAGYLHHHHHMAAMAAAAHQQQHRPAPLALPSTSGGVGYSREEQEDISNSMMGGRGVGGGIGGSGGGGALGSGKKTLLVPLMV